ncbi:hypothetical protein Sste5346_009687 [Sporothrix stenoceras]|uniref:FAD-binding domain-containing protein n=1 Tax=Sporothrix stenoceras TaxID=5173 RepID=A0ABR3YJ50_9PEZI
MGWDLPDKETRIFTSKKVISIETHADGVQVHCDDGSIEKSSIVVGCDGAYSRVRGIMQDLRLKASGHVCGSEMPIKAEYQALVGYLNRIPQMQPGTIWEVRGNKTSFQVFMQEDVGWFLAYKRLTVPVSQSTQYSDDDVSAFADSVMDHPVGEGLLFRDLWDVRKWTRMLNIEEGLVSEWHHDRIVLLGDSIHKMSPNAGLGMNQGWQGVVALTNLLRKLLSENPEPDTPALTAIFEKYKKTCHKSAKDAAFLSNLYLRTTCWHNVAYKVADILGPYLGGDPAIFRLMASPMIKRGLILDSTPEPGYKEGNIPWDNKPYVAEQ